jgi:hypothetical protein
MKNKLMTIAGAAAVLLAVAQTTQATPITGNIAFGGGATLDSGSVATATEVIANGWGTTTVSSESGAFGAILNGTTVNMSPSAWSFTSGSIPSFWSVGGFTFDLISSHVASNDGTFLNVLLNGTVTDGNPADVTTFNGTFQVANPPGNGQATYSARLSFNSVPDGGTTMMLLGAALTGLGFIKRKLSA